MVERLKEAIAKARQQREAESAGRPRTTPDVARPALRSDVVWAALPEIRPDPDHLERNRIVAPARLDAGRVPFDILRTRLLALCGAHGLRRIGITSPRKACGKTLVALNLAYSMARHPDARVVLLDLDLRAPSIGRRLGAPRDRRIADFLTGGVEPADFLMRWGDRLAVGLNDHVETQGAELIQSASAARALESMMDGLQPTLMLADLPPILVGDEALGSLDVLDGVLLVASGGQTSPTDLAECEHILTERQRLIGVVLNKGEDTTVEAYEYAAASD